MPNIKKSYGILCFRRKNQQYELIMVKKSVTYHFCAFVFGLYLKNNDAILTRLFNNMTYHEKIDILSLNFENLWYRIMKKRPDASNMQMYLKKASKFNIFLKDGGQRLRRLLTSSTNADELLEFPKGRKNEQKQEMDLDAAIREFVEETGIPETKIKVMMHVLPYIETYTDFGVTYQSVYYFAEAIEDFEPEVRFYDKQQINEISAVKWMAKNDLKHLKLDATTYKRLMKCFDKVIRKYKKAKKYKCINA